MHYWLLCNQQQALTLYPILNTAFTYRHVLYLLQAKRLGLESQKASLIMSQCVSSILLCLASSFDFLLIPFCLAFGGASSITSASTGDSLLRS